ncbi:MAG: aminotransferase class I/II-fold pyridoxal phosphate-dependent enzyme [candidate division FCPU426 bacterium]
MILEKKALKSPALNQNRAPLYEAVVAYAKKRKVSFHTPGHKHGSAIPAAFRRFAGDAVFDMDLTLLAEVDSLHDPISVIRDAQTLAAQAYGADAAFFLVNGSTAGNQTMILATCRPGDQVIIPRNCHQSVLSGVLLAGCEPVFMRPEVNPELGIYTNVTVGEVELALRRCPKAKAVLVTSPTYHGIAADVKRIAKMVHAHGIPLLVDEAHGPHFKFHSELPRSAMDCGADLCVQSTHKILAGMTQASLLLVRSKNIDLSRVSRMLKILTTTSPSYILMSSIDMARRQMALEGSRLLSRALRLARKAREEINDIAGLRCFGREVIGLAGIHDLDETKLTVAVGGLGMSGYEVALILNKRFNIQVEYADLFSVFLLVSFGNTDYEIRKLRDAFRYVAHKAAGRRKRPAPFRWGLPAFQPRPAMNPRKALFSGTQRLPTQKAIGRIAAESMAPYPPGIPLIVPGERITKEAIDYLLMVKDAGARIQGPQDASLKTIKVVTDLRDKA